MYSTIGQHIVDRLYEINRTPSVIFMYKGKKVKNLWGWNKGWIVHQVKTWVAEIKANPSKYDHIPDPKPFDPNMYQPKRPYNKEYNKIALDGTNKYRKAHGVPALVFDEQAAITAQKYAEELDR